MASLKPLTRCGYHTDEDRVGHTLSDVTPTSTRVNENTIECLFNGGYDNHKEFYGFVLLIGFLSLITIYLIYCLTKILIK